MQSIPDRVYPLQFEIGTAEAMNEHLADTTNNKGTPGTIYITEDHKQLYFAGENSEIFKLNRSSWNSFDKEPITITYHTYDANGENYVAETMEVNWFKGVTLTLLTIDHPAFLGWGTSEHQSEVKYSSIATFENNVELYEVRKPKYTVSLNYNWMGARVYSVAIKNYEDTPIDPSRFDIITVPSADGSTTYSYKVTGGDEPPEKIAGNLTYNFDVGREYILSDMINGQSFMFLDDGWSIYTYTCSFVCTGKSYDKMSIGYDATDGDSVIFFGEWDNGGQKVWSGKSNGWLDEKYRTIYVTNIDFNGDLYSRFLQYNIIPYGKTHPDKLWLSGGSYMWNLSDMKIPLNVLQNLNNDSISINNIRLGLETSADLPRWFTGMEILFEPSAHSASVSSIIYCDKTDPDNNLTVYKNGSWDYAYGVQFTISTGLYLNYYFDYHSVEVIRKLCAEN